MPARLPDFLFVGFPRSGTTSLFQALLAHPDIWIPEVKEMGFFTRDDWESSLDEYREEFAVAEPKQLVGEGTTAYVLRDHCAPRIEQALGKGVKIIILLRSPADRLHTEYIRRSSLGKETRPSLDAVLDDEIPLAEAEGVSEERTFYLHRAITAPKVKAYLDRFDQVLIKPTSVLKDLRPIYDFLGVPMVEAPSEPTHTNQTANRFRFQEAWDNAGPLRDLVRAVLPESLRTQLRESMTEKEKLPDATRQRILQFCHDDIQATAQLSGLDLSGWK